MYVEITKHNEKSVLRDQFVEFINADRDYTLEQFIEEVQRVADEEPLTGNSNCLTTVDEFAICSGALGDYESDVSFDGITDPMKCVSMAAMNIYSQFASDHVSEIVNNLETNIKRMFEMLGLDEDETIFSVHKWHHPFAAGNYVEIDYNSDFQKGSCDGVVKTAFELNYRVWLLVTNK
ncbi:MAG: hypothetical protein ACRCTW_05625 [Lactococcus garvieae]